MGLEERRHSHRLSGDGAGGEETFTQTVRCWGWRRGGIHTDCQVMGLEERRHSHRLSGDGAGGEEAFTQTIR